MDRLTITVGIEESNKYIFRQEGTIKTKCPCCDCEIHFVLKGIEDNLRLTPTVDWIHEWHMEGS